MTFATWLEQGTAANTAKIQRKGGLWRVTLYRNRRALAVYEHRQLRGACAMVLGASIPAAP